MAEKVKSKGINQKSKVARQKLRVWAIVFVSVFSFSALHAQKLKTLLESGDKAFADSDFFGASIYYNQAILQDSGDIQLQYKYAEASRLNYDYEIAKHWYTKVYKADAQGKLFPDCVFWLAMMNKNTGRYKDARKMFDKYAKKNKKKKNDYIVKKAQQEVLSCDYAMLQRGHLIDKSIDIVHLDSSVNSKVSEYAPVMFDTILYFSSLRNIKDRDKKNDINYNKIYTAVSGDRIKWQKAKELDSLFNKEKVHNANTAFNADYTRVYITRCEQKNTQNFQCEIYSSDWKNGHWEALKKLPPEINAPASNNTQPAIGYLGNEEVLFFSSSRAGGEGKMDIWYSKVNKDGTFGKPVNAGKKVNSIDDEITPFYCKPCQELFFSSDWHEGLGGFDIFKSDYKNNEFSKPKNLGPPINSSYNDIYFSISSQKTEAFFSSNRPESFFEEHESCCNDIYMFKIPGINEPLPEITMDSTEVFITQLKLLVPLTLYFHNDEPDKKTLATTTTKNYKTTYQDYAAMREQYKKEYSKGAKGEDIERAKNDIDLFFDDSVDVGMQELEKFAELLLKVLKDSEQVTITMKGYCSPLASTDYNINLAKRRISSLRNYFMEYQNGVFVPYVNNPAPNAGSITFINEDIGELKARSNVSDDYYDTKNSVYSPAAALERKIQIIALSAVNPKNNKPQQVQQPLQQTIQPVPVRQEQAVLLPEKRIHPAISPTSIEKTPEPEKTQPVSNTIITNVAKPEYMVQAGSHSQPANAETVQSALKMVIKHPIIVVKENDLYKVRITGFATKDEAKALIPKLENLGIKGAFVISPQ